MKFKFLGLENAPMAKAALSSAYSLDSLFHLAFDWQ